MCGIVTGFSKKNKRISKPLLRRYRDQKGRGTEGFGYLAIYPNKVKHVRRETEREIEKELMSEDSPFVMFHHRMPTSTINVEECAHPIKVSHPELDYDYYVVHNGVIGNSDELKKKHEELEYVYNTVLKSEDKTVYRHALSGREYFTHTGSAREKYNDSEALAIEVARCVDGMTREIDCTGTIAFVCISVDKESGKALKMYYGHNERNPLTIQEDKDFVWIRSEGGKALDTHKIYCYDIANKTTTERYQHIGREYKSEHTHRDWGGYNYKEYHGNKNTVSELPSHTVDKTKPTSLIRSPYQDDYRLGEDIDYDDPSEHDYKDNRRRMGFDTSRNNNTHVQDTLDWGEGDPRTVQFGGGLSGNDDIPYDVVMKDKRVVDLIDRTIRLQRMRDQYVFAVDKCEEMLSDPYQDHTDTLEAQQEAEKEIEKLDNRMLEIEGNFYSMEEIHGNIDYYSLVDEYKAGFSDEELDELLGIKHNMSSVTEDGRLF